MKLTVIGLGLIGGSMAKDLRRTGFATVITGVDSDPDHAAEALRLNRWRQLFRMLTWLLLPRR